MSSQSLRDWLSLLRQHGELLEIEEEVHWKYELACLTRRIVDLPGGAPAVLFKNITDHHHTVSKEFFCNSLASYKRIAMAMGLPPESTYRDIVDGYLPALNNTIPPVTVDAAPCHEVVVQGDDVDILQFPTPHFHPTDGGRYIGTFHLTITKDIDTGIPNLGLYRHMIHDRNHVGGFPIKGADWEMHLRKWKERDGKMPVAICFGVPQTLLFTALSFIDHPPDELSVAGGILGEAVELVKCKTIDLEVPAESEIVLEGYIDDNPENFRMEGPFGEVLGYLDNEPGLKPVIEINCITHRKNPILQGSLEGRCVPGAPDDHQCGSIFSAVYAINLLRKNKIDVVDAHAPVGAIGCFKVIVAIRQHHRGEALRVANALWGSAPGFGRFKEVVVVDEDIDVHNPNLVDFAIATRVDPIEDITIIDNTSGIPLDPRIHPSEKQPYMFAGRWSRVCIDALRPFHWAPVEAWGGRKYPPVQHWPDEIEDLIDSKWEQYGLGSYPMPPRWKMTY